MGQSGGAWCTADELCFALPDPERRYTAVRLDQHVGIAAHRLAFTRADDGWRLTVPHPAVQRLEYRLELLHRDGRTEQVPDPGNPHVLDGDFGPRSVLSCPDYTAPAWLDAPAAPGTWHDVTLPAPSLGVPVTGRLWSPEHPSDRILVAHDGPAYDRCAALGRFSAAMIAAARLPPYHLVLLDPGDRLEWYSASSRYARALATEVLPQLHERLGGTRAAVGIGASLGALAMLHAQRRWPAAFAGLFLQSGSFFQPQHDRQEAGFARWLRIVRFTGQLHRAATGPAVPALLTCGRVEENLANNREATRTLWRQGYPAALYEVPDAHTWTGWRDAFDPYLVDLMNRSWQ